jgi:hypothetical protein
MFKDSGAGVNQAEVKVTTLDFLRPVHFVANDSYVYT